jgi:hypothetical protein
MHVRRLVTQKKAASSLTALLLGQRKRAGLAAWHASLALSAITVGVIVITAAFISQGSSLASSVSSRSTTQPAAQSYPLVWAPNPLSACEAGAFCINATLAFSGQTSTDDNTPSAMTITGSNATTIIISSTTTIIGSSRTAWIYPSPATSYFVTLFAFVQDAVTGQNATTPGGTPVIGSGCYIRPTGVTHCLVSAPYLPAVTSGHPYKVTVFVTQTDVPCSLQKADDSCSSQLLASPSPAITVSEGEG